MNIDWNIQHLQKGYIHSATSYANVKELVRGISESGIADFFVRHETKTSLNIEISSPGAPGHSFGVALVPPGAEKFKFLDRSHYNIFTDETTATKQFRLTRTQGLPELREYLSLVLSWLVPGADALKVNVTLYQLPELAA